MTIRLDRKRQFGSIHPPVNLESCNKTAFHEQDGFMFDVHGAIIEEALSEKDRFRMRMKEAELAATEAARAAHDRAMEEAGFGKGNYADFKMPSQTVAKTLSATDVVNNPNEIKMGENESHSQEGDFDIAGWAAGRVQAQWFAVSKAIREKHGFAAQNKQHALQFLIDNGIIQSSVVAI